MEVHGHVPERRVLGQTGELRPGTLAGDRAVCRRGKRSSVTLVPTANTAHPAIASLHQPGAHSTSKI